MFSEVLKISPKLDDSDLNAMESKLSSRFGRIAKKFGKGLGAALTGGGIAGLALGFIDKILNPLKETQEAIDRVLKQGDDVVTNAKQFGTTAGKLFKLQKLGESTGLDAESLNVLITKFQAAVAEAEKDKTKQTSVRQFVGEKDTADAFFNFIQALQKMDKNQQILVQQEVFGEKQILKMADFLQTDFAKQIKLIGALPAEAYTKGLEKLGDLNDLADALTAKRTLNDTLTKSKIVTEGMVRAQDASAKLELQKENQRIQSYQDLRAISDTTTRIMTLVEQGVGMIGKFINFLTPAVNKLVDSISKIGKSRMFRGIFGGSDE